MSRLKKAYARGLIAEFRTNIGILNLKSLLHKKSWVLCFPNNWRKSQRKKVAKEARVKATTTVNITTADLSYVLNVKPRWLKRSCFVKMADDRVCFYTTVSMEMKEKNQHAAEENLADRKTYG